MNIAVFNILILSLSAHKEERFLMPVLPLLFLMTAFGLQEKKKSKAKRLAIFFAIFSNLCLLGFLGFYNNRGSLDTLDFIRNSPQMERVQFFVQCH